jgi:23S rRNA pseudouridine2605 synthase
MHPSTEIVREYAVRILGNVSDETQLRLKQGVALEDGVAHFTDIKFSGGEGANKWYHVTVTEGRNRLVRKLWESQKVIVSRLIRVRYGPIMLPKGLRTHSFHELDSKELNALMKFVDLTVEKQPGKKSPSRSDKPITKVKRTYKSHRS